MIESKVTETQTAETDKRTLVVYHGNCADGFGAMWCFWREFRDDMAYMTGHYNMEATDVEIFRDRNVYLLDFSYKRPVVEAIIKVAKSVKLVDHHKSALEDLAGLEGLDFTNSTTEHSGAMLAWMLLNDKPAPIAIRLIEDRDLWRFQYPETKPFSQYLFSLPYDVKQWNGLILLLETGEQYLQSCVDEGDAIERKHMKDVKELVERLTRPMRIGGHLVTVASLPYTMASDAGNLMCQYSFNEDNGDPPVFAATYYDTDTRRVFSLRSIEGGMDVSKIASAYGGGGHKNAAGFSVPRDHELAKS